MIDRKQAALAALLFFFPFAANAEKAPAHCTTHFISGELPDVAANRTPETKLLCFSQYAVLHSGLSKTPVWSAEHLTRARVQKAGALKRKNPFHAEQQLPPDQRSELIDYKGSNFDRGHMSPNGDMPTAKAQKESF